MFHAEEAGGEFGGEGGDAFGVVLCLGLAFGVGCSVAREELGMVLVVGRLKWGRSYIFGYAQHSFLTPS